MELSALTAVGPVDGRYAAKTAAAARHLQRIRPDTLPHPGRNSLVPGAGGQRGFTALPALSDACDQFLEGLLEILG